MAPKRRCPVCRSKSWHKEPSSGLIACSEGHVLQNYRNESNDMDEFGAHSLRKRTFKSDKKKKARSSKADPKLYHGAKAKYLYFQCQQLLLRKQMEALIDLWSLPPEFQIVCRDIWALHLSLLPDPPPAEPLFHAQERRDNPDASKDTSLVETSKADATFEEECPVASQVHESSGSDTSSDSADEADVVKGSPELDPELEELLRENSASSSSDDEAHNPQLESSAPTRSKRKIVRNYMGPQLEGSAANIAVLMMTCWTMRIPVIYADFSNLIDLYQLPYLDPLLLLPHDMTRHLTKHAIQSLSPRYPPTTLAMHALTSRLARMAFTKCGIFTPEVNAAPILWRAVRALGGTPVLYGMVKRLAHTMSFPLTLHHNLAPKLKRNVVRDPETHRHDNAAPELSLVATTIVVLKMVYGLDGKDRSPVEDSDPTCALPSRSEFLGLVKQMNENGVKTKDALRGSSTNGSVAEFDDAMLDDYMDFCENALLDTQREYSRLLTNHFVLPAGNSAPVSRAAVPKDENVSTHVLSAFCVDDCEGGLRPGQCYSIYNSRDTLGVLPNELEVVLNRAAAWARIPEDHIAGVVEVFERRFDKWWTKQRTKEGQPEEEDNVEDWSTVHTSP